MIKTPNYCDNEVYITGSKDELAKIKVFVKGKEKDEDTNKEEEMLFDFDKIVPMPKELMITSGSNVDNCRDIILAEKGDLTAIEKMLSHPWVREKIMTKEQLLDHLKTKVKAEDMEEAKQSFINEEKYGAKDWYDWSRDNWGTKWNAARPTLCESSRRLVYQFDTAWAPPLPVIKKLSELFPNVTIKIKFYEMGVGFQGTYIFKAGKILSSEDKEYHGHRGG